MTLVHKNVLNRGARGRLETEKANERVVSANGQPLEILGTCRLRIRLGGIHAVESVLVHSDITQECLVGVDLLSKHGCVIDFETKTVKAGRESVKINCKNSGSAECCRLSLAETVTVSGFHEILMPARIGVVSDKVTGIIEPSLGFADKHPVMMARVLAEPKEELVPVRMMNPSPDPVLLYQGTTLGTFTPLDEGFFPRSYPRLANSINQSTIAFPLAMQHRSNKPQGVSPFNSARSWNET